MNVQADIFGLPSEAMEFRVTSGLVKLTYAYLGNSFTKFNVGKIVDLTVPRSATMRNLWVAFDALNGKTGSTWYLSGRIVFWLCNQKVTEMPISKGNTIAPGMAINIYAPSTGAGMQPALRATALETYANAYMSVDMPCFTFNVECDRITMEIDSVSLGGPVLWFTDIWIAQTGLAYNQADMDAHAVIKSGTSTSGYVGPWIGLFTVCAPTSNGVGPLMDIDSKKAVRRANSMPVTGWNDLTSNPTLSIYANTAGTGASLGCSTDGIVDLIAGLVVTSQYPGGL